MADRMKYVSAQRITHTGAAQAVTIPATENAKALCARIASEAGDTRFAINATATAASTWLAEDDTVYIGPIHNLTSLSTFGAAGTFTNVLWFAVID